MRVVCAAYANPKSATHRHNTHHWLLTGRRQNTTASVPSVSRMPGTRPMRSDRAPTRGRPSAPPRPMALINHAARIGSIPRSMA